MDNLEDMSRLHVILSNEREQNSLYNKARH